MATIKEGLGAGILIGIVLQLMSLVRISGVRELFAFLLLVALTLYVTVYHGFRKGNRFNPTLDGFIMGFGWTIVAISLVEIFRVMTLLRLILRRV